MPSNQHKMWYEANGSWTCWFNGKVSIPSVHYTYKSIWLKSWSTLLRITCNKIWDLHFNFVCAIYMLWEDLILGRSSHFLQFLDARRNETRTHSIKKHGINEWKLTIENWSILQFFHVKKINIFMCHIIIDNVSCCPGPKPNTRLYWWKQIWHSSLMWLGVQCQLRR